MEVGDLVAYEFVTPNGDWSWSLGTVSRMDRACLLEVIGWSDAATGTLRTQEAKEYHECTREADDCANAAKRLANEVGVLRKQMIEQRAEAEENARIAAERLRAAQKAVRSIDNSHLREMRSYRTPPTLVKETLGAVLHLLRQSPHPETWENVQRVVRRADFIASVLNFDPNDEDQELHRSVMTNYLSNPSLTVENVHMASRAAGPLLQWLFAKMGATSAHVELRSFEEDLRHAAAQLKEKSDRIAILQQKSAAARARADEVMQRSAMAKLSFRKPPPSHHSDPSGSLTRPTDISSKTWTRNEDTNTTTCILTSSVLAIFGEEPNRTRVLTKEEEERISDAFHNARRDQNNERLSMALEVLSSRDQEISGLRQSLENSTTQNEELLKEVDRYREKFGAVDAQRQTLYEELERLKATTSILADVENENKAFINMAESLQNQTKALETSKKELENALERVKTEDSKKQERIVALQTEVATLKVAVEERETLLATNAEDQALAQRSAANREAACENRIGDLERQCAALQQALKEVHEEKARIIEDNSSHSNQLGDQVNHLRQLLFMTEAAKGDKEALVEKQLKDWEQERSRSEALESRLMDLDAKMLKCKEIIVEMEAQNTSKDQEILRVSEELATSKNSLEATKRLCEQLQEELSQRSGQVAKLTATLNDREATLEEAIRTSEVLKQRMEDAHTAYTSELQTERATSEGLAKELAEQTNQLSAAQSRLATLEVQCVENREKYHETTVASLNQGATFAEQRGALQARIAELETQLSMETKARIDIQAVLAAMRDDSDKRYAAVVERCSAEEATVAQVKEQLTTASLQLKSSQGEVESLQMVVQGLRSDLDAARASLVDHAHAKGAEIGRTTAEVRFSQETIRTLQDEVERLRASEKHNAHEMELQRLERAILQRELDAQQERSRMEIVALEQQIAARDSAGTATASGAGRDGLNESTTVDAEEYEEMRQRLERELEYMQSVHNSVVMQHVQLERELRSHVEGLMSETESLRGQLRSNDDRIVALQAALEEKSGDAQAAMVQLSANEEQLAKLLDAIQGAAMEREAMQTSLNASRAECSTLNEQLQSLMARLVAATQEISAHEKAAEASRDIESELRNQLEAVSDENENLQAVCSQRECTIATITETFETKLQTEQEQHREAVTAFQEEIDRLCTKMSESSKQRSRSSGDLMDTITKLQNEKRDAVEDLMKQLEASWAAEEEAKRRVRDATMEAQELRVRMDALERERDSLHTGRRADAEERSTKINDLVQLHHQQLLGLRQERDAAIHRLHEEERARSDFEFTVAELRSKLARAETSSRAGSLGATANAETSAQVDELRLRLQALSQETESDRRLLREKDLQIHDLRRQMMEHDLHIVELDQRRSEAAAVLREKSAMVREREMALEQDRMLMLQRSEREQQLQRAREAASRDAMAASSTSQQQVVERGSGAPRITPRGASTTTPPTTNANTPRREGAHLVVHLGALTDIQHDGKPIAPREIYVKLKTIKEKYRSTMKDVRSQTIEIGEQFVFHLALPNTDVVHIAVFARHHRSLFDGEVLVGEVDVSMATLARGIPRTRNVMLVQDAGTKRGRCAGFIAVTMRSDDFGSSVPPTERQLLLESQRYLSVQQRFTVDFPEKLHAVDVYMAGESGPIEETQRHRKP